MPKRVKILDSKWHRKQEHLCMNTFRSFQYIRFVKKQFFLLQTMGKEGKGGGGEEF